MVAVAVFVAVAVVVSVTVTALAVVCTSTTTIDSYKTWPCKSTNFSSSVVMIVYVGVKVLLIAAVMVSA